MFPTLAQRKLSCRHLILICLMPYSNEQQWNLFKASFQKSTHLYNLKGWRSKWIYSFQTKKFVVISLNFIIRHVSHNILQSIYDLYEKTVQGKSFYYYLRKCTEKNFQHLWNIIKKLTEQMNMNFSILKYCTGFEATTQVKIKFFHSYF